MLHRKYLFPHVIEMNYQAAQYFGVNVYLIDGGDEWMLIDIGEDQFVDEIIELIRQMDFKLSACKMIVATHADVDHVQGLARARERLKTKVVAHPASAGPLETGDKIQTYALIEAQGRTDVPMPPCPVDRKVKEKDVLTCGPHRLAVWHTPGHTPGQIALKMGNLLFSADNIYMDSCVGVIDAHHGSNLKDFVASLERIQKDDCEFLLPSHGPAFRRDPKILQKAIDRLNQYRTMMDFGTCMDLGWPLGKEWEQDILSGKMPDFSGK
jgi:glyoxylase-like metal-dependent hydrolase (beta-lactamase superfamily II)